MDRSQGAATEALRATSSALCTVNSGPLMEELLFVAQWILSDRATAGARCGHRLRRFGSVCDLKRSLAGTANPEK